MKTRPLVPLLIAAAFRNPGRERRIPHRLQATDTAERRAMRYQSWNYVWNSHDTLASPAQSARVFARAARESPAAQRGQKAFHPLQFPRKKQPQGLSQFTHGALCLRRLYGEGAGIALAEWGAGSRHSHCQRRRFRGAKHSACSTGTGILPGLGRCSA